jgi:hypothetical protein
LEELKSSLTQENFLADVAEEVAGLAEDTSEKPPQTDTPPTEQPPLPDETSVALQMEEPEGEKKEGQKKEEKEEVKEGTPSHG